MSFSLSRWPPLLTRHLSALGFRLEGAAALSFCLPTRAVVVGTVGTWESGGLGEISREVWEAVATFFWFSPVSMPPPFPPRFVLTFLFSGRPQRPDHMHSVT